MEQTALLLEISKIMDNKLDALYERIRQDNKENNVAHDDIVKRIGKIEQRQYWLSGAATGVSFLISTQWRNFINFMGGR